MKRVSAFLLGGRHRVALLVLVLVLGVFQPQGALAQCETTIDSSAGLLGVLGTFTAGPLVLYGTEMATFATAKFIQADMELAGRVNEIAMNISGAFEAWSDRLDPVLRKMSMQLSLGHIDQTRMLGAMIDAQLLNEAIKNKQLRKLEAVRRYMPSELTCQADSAGPGQTKAYQMSRALTRSFAKEDSPRISNAVGSPAANGTFAEIKILWDEYVANFCDDAKGDQGCAPPPPPPGPPPPPPPPGPLLGKHKDIPALLWGDRQTIDMSNPDNRLMVNAAMRYLVRPLSADPILPGAMQSIPGRQALLARRAEAARINTVYNVLGQMVAERIGGSGVNVQSMRVAAGMPPADASVNASYREIQQSMTKDRFLNPQYALRMSGNPEQVAREQASINATRLELLNDIYRRSEEMLFMEAAAYSRDLDKQIPSSAIFSTLQR